MTSVTSANQQHMVPSVIQHRLKQVAKLSVSSFLFFLLSVPLCGCGVWGWHMLIFNKVLIIKTWVNSWATSSRLHEEVQLPCLFGCQDAPDHMIHYVQCPFWLLLLTKLFQENLPSPMPLQRLGLVNPTVQSLLSVACSFAGDHAMKRHASSVGYSDASLSSVQVAVCHGILLDAFCAAAGDCSLPCTAFSVLLRSLL